MKAHRTDLVSFAFGLIFLALAAWWLSAQLLGLALPPVGWFLAGALILIGVLGLVGALRSGRYAAQDGTADAGAPAVGPTSGLPADVPAPISGAGSALSPTAPFSGAGMPAPGTGRQAVEVEPPIWEAGWAQPSDTAPEPGPGLLEPQATTAGIHPAWQVDRSTRETGRDEEPTREIDRGSDEPTRTVAGDSDGPTQAVTRDSDEPAARPER
ncbi:hypothetical protein GA0070620_5245 [Micromonospora krabiensis]|uniref:Uncharacterized protein n=1 Tax=Micromonospora krabiensis TaxID=307121 RepID=A0A1C3NAN6_9ACTN|nr:hypothetical protein [Micromonospora krabiensis]SBV29665.1 hypothetical protein GA0070620_5245 [Micromonospora krabiensis]